MPQNCVVIGCMSRGEKSSNRKFFAFPMLRNKNAKSLAITQARQKAWLVALNRNDFFEYQYQYARVCDLHFISGRSACYTDVDDPDWVPSKHLGYEVEKEESNRPSGESLSVIEPIIKLADFNNICRLCLTKHDEHSVNLFSTPKIVETTDSGLFVAELIESFCSIKIRKDDGLPESICQHCWNVVSSIQSLRIVSHESDQLLCNILSSHNASSANHSNEITDFEIEFIDTQSNVKKEALDELETHCSVDDSTPLEHTLSLKIEPRTERSCVRVNNREESTLKTKRIGAKVINKRDRQKCSLDDSTPLGYAFKTKRSDFGVNIKSRKKSKYGVKKISCEMCGKLVASNFIEFHLNVHKDIRPFKCEVEGCDKHFTSPAHLRQHFKKVHVYSITRPHKCDICGSGFIQKSSLITHRTYHFDPQIPCSICGQLYRNKRALTRHSLVHTGERKFSCSECKKSFQTSFTLKIHMRTHTFEKPYSCTECTKTFAYKCLLKAHIEKHHPKEGAVS